jgi:hypothetical protein
MESADITRIRRFALIVAVLLITLVVAEVELEIPVRMSPLGIPIVIRRPDLLTIALVIGALYSTLRYIYYGMLLQPSPMRARRELMAGRPVHTPAFGTGIENYAIDIGKEIDRYFPKIGKTRVTFETSWSAMGGKIEKVNVPPVIRALCWIEDLDFLLPILANVGAVALWATKYKLTS